MRTTLIGNFSVSGKKSLRMQGKIAVSVFRGFLKKGFGFGLKTEPALQVKVMFLYNIRIICMPLNVLVSIGGIVLVSWSTKDLRVDRDPLSAVCSVMGALLFALFLVLLRRRVDNEDKLNMPMFYGLFTTFWCYLVTVTYWCHLANFGSVSAVLTVELLVMCKFLSHVQFIFISTVLQFYLSRSWTVSKYIINLFS